MLVEAFKRTSSNLILPALILFAIQFYQTGKVSVAEIAVFLIVFLLIGTACEATNVLWTRRFGAGKGSTIGKAAIWFVVAVCMYLFFRHMDRA